MADIDALRSQQYSTTIALLLREMGDKFGEACVTTPVTGSKAARLLSQVGSAYMQEQTTRANPAMNERLDHTGRWVFFRRFAWGTVVDDIDLLQTNISPQSAYSRSAVEAANATTRSLFLSAFFGDAKTGETGGTTTSFPASQQVAVTEGVGSATGMNLSKMEAAMEILLSQNVNLDAEVPIMAISPKQHRELKALTEVKSSDFNNRKVLGEDGMLKHFNGFDLIITNSLPTDSNSYRRIPVWVKSGMGKGVWQPVKGEVRKRPDLQGNPDYIETSMSLDFTRLEEGRCVEIKCAES